MTTAIAEYSATDAALADLRTKYEAVVFDVTNGKGMAEAKKARAEIRDYRVSLEKCRVEIKAPALERCRQIDSEAKRITAELESLENPIDRQIKDEMGRKQREKEEGERIERERVAAINARFDALKACAAVQADASSASINQTIGDVESNQGVGIPEDLRSAWTHTQRQVVSSLRDSLDRAVTREAEAEELRVLREQRAAMQAEQERLSELERQRVADEVARAKAAEDIARAEQAARDAQEAARRAAEQAELDRAEAVRQAEARATREAEAREAARREAEAREAERLAKIEQARAENLRHRKKINNAAADALKAEGFTDEQARQVVTLIASGKIPYTTINY